MKRVIYFIAAALALLPAAPAQAEGCWYCETYGCHGYERVDAAKPTCTSDGMTAYECRKCGDTKTEKLDRLPHEYGAWKAARQADGRKSLAWGGGVFLIIMGLAALIMALTDSLTGGALFMAGMAALIAALTVLGILQGQLKQAAKQSAASKYVRSGSFQLGACSDRFLYADTKRRAIPSDADKGEKG